jgi:hypothetical protein
MKTNFIKNLFVGKIIKDSKFASYKLVSTKNDYGALLNEMNKISAEYESMPSYKWNVEELRSQVNKYEKEIDDYVNGFKNPGSIGKIMPKLEEGLLRMAYLLFTVDNKSVVTELKSIDIDTKNFYFNSRTRELYNTILKRIGEKEVILDDVRELNSKGQVHYLFDIYNNDYSGMSLKIFNSYQSDDNAIYYRVYSYFRDISSKHNPSNWFFLSDEADDINLSDLYYFTKFIGMDRNKFISDFNGYRDSHGLCKPIMDLLLKAYFAYLDKEYDNRIMFMPKFICVSGESEETFAKKINPFNRIKALYITSLKQLDNAKYYFDTYDSIKKVFIKDSIMKEFKRTSGNQYDACAYYYARRFSSRSTINAFNELKDYRERDQRVANGSLSIKLIPVSDDISISDLTLNLNNKAKKLVK